MEHSISEYFRACLAQCKEYFKELNLFRARSPGSSFFSKAPTLKSSVPHKLSDEGAIVKPLILFNKLIEYVCIDHHGWTREMERNQSFATMGDRERRELSDRFAKTNYLHRTKSRRCSPEFSGDLGGLNDAMFRAMMKR